MRIAIVALFMLFVIIYAQRDWFRALCCVVVFTALTDYPGLPNPLDAKGINHWSVMLGAVVMAWIISRFMHWRSWNIPRGWLIVISIYMFVELVGIARLCSNVDVFKMRAAQINSGYASYNVRAVLVDMLYSPLRFMLLGLLMFDGVRSKRQLLYGLCSVLGAVLIYAIVVDKEIPLSSLAGDGMQFRHRITKWTNRHPNDLARLFAASFWIGISIWQLKVGSLTLRRVVPFLLGFIVIALGHTHSRGGYLAFVAVGIVVAITVSSWRTFAVLAMAVIVAGTSAPSITKRIFTGVDMTGDQALDMGEVTAGRDVIWAAALVGIEESPLIGHGSKGYVVSSALMTSIAHGGGEGHPHNAYLETLLDHGILGAFGRLGPLLYVLGAGVVLVRRRRDPLLRLAGVAAVAWATACFIMGLSGQHWGFSENLFTFWCVAGLTVRALTLPDTVPQRVGAPARYRRQVRRAPGAVIRAAHPRGLLPRGGHGVDDSRARTT